LSRSSTLDTAGFYSKIGSATSLIIGFAIVAVGLLMNQMIVIVFGFLSLICAVASYITVAEKIRTGDITGARTWSIVYGVLLLIFGLLIGGIFFLFAHSKLAEAPELARPRPEEYRPPYPRPPRPPKPTTPDLLDHPAGYLEPLSGPDYEHRTLRHTIDSEKTKIGRGPFGKDEKTPNDLRLDDDDTTMSRDQAWLRVDPDTFRVYIKHDPMGEKSETRIDGQPIPPGKDVELRDGSQIEFGRSGERWQFTRTGAPRSRTKPTSD
jgi:hypothetical protein